MSALQDMRGATMDRRAEPRLDVSVPTRLDSDPDGRVGITQNLSRSGTRLLCIQRVEPGQVVELWFSSPSPSALVRATGRVIRAEPFSVSGPWRCAVAVRFDELLPVSPEVLVGKA
jgi:hypothetical protein